MKKDIGKKAIKVCTMFVCILIILVGITVAFFSGTMISSVLVYRNHWDIVTVEQSFIESNKELKNPDRGFYSMVGFFINDSEQNFDQQVKSKVANDSNALSLIQINLGKYKNGAITETGLKNIKALCQALESIDKQYIIRFLYDWDGKGMEAEPEDVKTILEHMNQVEDILEEYKSMIFTFQGVFVGSWGEMHGTRHMSRESMKLLMQQWFSVTPEETYLSVRTPQQWRIVTEISEESKVRSTDLSRRLGLYNDGMMGTEQDTGTYGVLSKTEAGEFGQWNREEELAFQEELCKYVPNGGEVIIDNLFNDFENAVQSMKTMHVTYLNQAYDGRVLTKWQNHTVTGEGVFYGMDGLSYINRMLGYRHLIDTVSLNYNFWPDELDIAINIKNVGFAPIYKEPEKYLTVKNKETGVIQTYPVTADLRSLAGGNDTDQILTIKKTLSLAGFEPGEYEVYFSMRDTDSGWYLELANEQEMQEYGYLVGAFSVGEIKNPFTGEPLNIGEMLDTFLSKVEALYEQRNFGRR